MTPANCWFRCNRSSGRDRAAHVILAAASSRWRIWHGHSDGMQLLLKDRSIYVSMNMRLCLGPAYGEDHRMGTLDWAPASAARSACIFCSRKAWQHGEGGSATRSYAAGRFEG